MEISNDIRKTLTKKRWFILAMSCITNLCIGSMYAWSALSAPMAVELNANLSSVFSTANAVSFIAMIIGGILNDKYGPRWVMLTGGVMFGAGMFLSGLAQSVTHLILSYGICLGLGMSLVYGCTISNTIKFFPDRRGMVGGMTTASYGISSVIFAPLADVICARFGARATFMILGAIFFVVVSASAFVIMRCPSGFVPEGFEPKIPAVASSKIDVSPAEMLKKPVFYIMLFMLTAGGTFGLMTISNAKGLSLALGGVTPATATLFVSILCLFNTAGRLIAGTLSDRFGRINTLTYAMIIALAGLGVLAVASVYPSVWLCALGLMLVGICFGTFMGVFPGFCADRFGTKYNTVNYGIMWIGFSLAGIVGPMILTSVFEKTRSYLGAFLIAIGMAIGGLILGTVYRVLVKKESDNQE
jgi:MFS family permease